MTSGVLETAPGRCRLDDIPQLAALSAPVLEELTRLCRFTHYQAGQTVVHEGDHASGIGCVKSGFLRMQKSLSDGRQHIVGLLVEGDIFGRVFDGPLHFAIEAATDTDICMFPRGPFEALLLKSAELERVMLLNILNELDRARDWMLILTNQKVVGRVAGFLLTLCTRFAGIDHLLSVDRGHIDVHIPISRLDLAHLLGTRPETVSRAFHSMADEGSIEIVKPDLIRILDLEALAAEAGNEDLADPATLTKLLKGLRKTA